jgi:hypothetical protein
MRDYSVEKVDRLMSAVAGVMAAGSGMTMTPFDSKYDPWEEMEKAWWAVDGGPDPIEEVL